MFSFAENEKPASLPFCGRNAGLLCNSPALLKACVLPCLPGLNCLPVSCLFNEIPEALPVKGIQVCVCGQDDDSFAGFCAYIRMETDHLTTNNF